MKKSSKVALVLITATLASSYKSLHLAERNSFLNHTHKAADNNFSYHLPTLLWLYSFRPYGNIFFQIPSLPDVQRNGLGNEKKAVDS